MPVKAVLLDAYGTLLRNEDMMQVPRRIVTDHGLSVPIDDVLRAWSDLYSETQLPPFRTLREIQEEILLRVLRRFGVGGDAAPYVDLFFRVTTKVELYPEALTVFNALGHVRSAIVSNADHEHLAAWNVTLPVEFLRQVSSNRRCHASHVAHAGASSGSKFLREVLQGRGMREDTARPHGDMA